MSFPEEGTSWSMEDNLVVPGTPVMDKKVRKDEVEEQTRLDEERRNALLMYLNLIWHR